MEAKEISKYAILVDIQKVVNKVANGVALTKVKVCQF